MPNKPLQVINTSPLVAGLHGLRVAGSLGLLLALHRHGLVPSVSVA